MYRHRGVQLALFKRHVRAGLTYPYEPCAFEGTYQLHPAYDGLLRTHRRVGYAAGDGTETNSIGAEGVSLSGIGSPLSLR